MTMTANQIDKALHEFGLKDEPPPFEVDVLFQLHLRNPAGEIIRTISEPFEFEVSSDNSAPMPWCFWVELDGKTHHFPGEIPVDVPKGTVVKLNADYTVTPERVDELDIVRDNDGRRQRYLKRNRLAYRLAEIDAPEIHSHPL